MRNERKHIEENANFETRLKEAAYFGLTANNDAAQSAFPSGQAVASRLQASPPRRKPCSMPSRQVHFILFFARLSVDQRRAGRFVDGSVINATSCHAP